MRLRSCTREHETNGMFLKDSMVFKTPFFAEEKWQEKRLVTVGNKLLNMMVEKPPFWIEEKMAHDLRAAFLFCSRSWNSSSV